MQASLHPSFLVILVHPSFRQTNILSFGLHPFQNVSLLAALIMLRSLFVVFVPILSLQNMAMTSVVLFSQRKRTELFLKMYYCYRLYFLLMQSEIIRALSSSI